MRLIRRLIRNEAGAAAVEFSLTIVPFLLLIFAILEMAFMLFVDSALDAALQKTARHVKTGDASKNNWTLPTFKSNVCANMSGAFDCSERLLVKTTIMADFTSVSYTSAVQNGTLSVTESFALGQPGSYILIEAFMTFGSVLAFSGINAHTLDDGSYALSSSALFRIEPFE